MDVMQLRRNLLMQQTSRLPSAYQEVEWINGNSCDIDLNYVPKVNPKAVTRFAVSASGDRDAMGFKTNTYPSFIIDVYVRGTETVTSWFNRFGSTSAYSFNYQFGNYTGDDFHDFEFGENVKVDGVQYVTITGVTWSGNTQSFHVFAARTVHVGIRMCYFKLYDGDNLVRDLVPCYRKADDVIGMYDLVTGTFFTSSVGVFTKGNNI